MVLKGQKRNTWFITDTHFGHQMLIDKGYRPANFQDLIVENWHKQVQPQDVVIHLGDVAFTKIDISVFPGHKVLVRGNHDNQSANWYLDHGWDFVCDSFIEKKFNRRWYFTHEPIYHQPGDDWDVNVHGHLHNNDHCGVDDPYYQYSLLLSLEKLGYKLVRFEDLEVMICQKQKAISLLKTMPV